MLVKKGKTVGGDFKHVPGCRTSSSLSCVIAFSTFNAPVPAKSLFGRAGAGLGIGYPAFSVHTTWVQFNSAWTGGCSSADNAHVLHITDGPGAAHLHAIPDATWGLHLADANIALGNLVSIVAQEITAYNKRHA